MESVAASVMDDAYLVRELLFAYPRLVIRKCDKNRLPFS